jgi:membrane-associated phospholipid phosphatase
VSAWLQRLRAFLAAAGLGLVVGFFISVACLWIFAELADEIGEDDFLVALDNYLANTIHAGAQPNTISFFLFVTLFGSQVVWGLTIAVGLYYLWYRQWLSLLIWISALGGGQLLNALLKQWFARSRPVFENPIVVERFFSFPSGHAMMSMIAYGMLAYFLAVKLQTRMARLILIVATTVIVLLVGFSRIYLGVHYLSDVLGGYAAGGLWLFTCISMREYILRRSGRRKTAAAL